VYSKHPPKSAIPVLRKEVPQVSTHLLQNFGDFMNSQHNALNSNKIIKNTKSIKVTPQNGRADAEEVMMYKNFKSKAGFSKMDIFKMSFFENLG